MLTKRSRGMVWINITRACHGWVKGEVVNVSEGVAEVMVSNGDAEYREKSMTYRAVENKGVTNGNRTGTAREHDGTCGSDCLPGECGRNVDRR